ADVAAALVERGVITQEQADSADLVDRETVAEWLAAKGYDGIVYRNAVEGRGDSYIALHPAQIKSAIGNRGTFDPADPRISYALRDEFARDARSVTGNLRARLQQL